MLLIWNFPYLFFHHAYNNQEERRPLLKGNCNSSFEIFFLSHYFIIKITLFKECTASVTDIASESKTGELGSKSRLDCDVHLWTKTLADGKKVMLSRFVSFFPFLPLNMANPGSNKCLKLKPLWRGDSFYMLDCVYQEYIDMQN